MCKNCLNNEVKRHLAYDCCFTVPSLGNSGSLMLLWINELDVNVVSYSAGHKDAVVNFGRGQWRFHRFLWESNHG